MATVTASHVVSHVSGGANVVDAKKNLSQVGLRNQVVSHNGLRSVNKVDLLQVRSNVKVVSKQTKENKKVESINSCVLKYIICTLFIGYTRCV